MAHELEIINGQAQMAYVGEVPWHGLGVRVDPDISPQEMLEAAGLDWNVEKKPMFYKAGGIDVEVPGKSVLVRDSDAKVLDIVGSDWNVLQNKQAFEFFNDFVSSGDMEMHTAGSIKEGQRVWALAKVNEAFEVFQDDVIEQYLLFSNPHEYGMSIDVRMTPTRVVCNNTLSVALKNDSQRMVKVNHSRAFDAEEVKRLLGVANQKLQAYKEAAVYLSQKPFKTDDVMKEYFRKIFPTQAKDGLGKNAKLAIDNLETQPGAEYGRGTYWQLFNTVTYLTDHKLGRTNDNRLQSSWYGKNQKLKTKALDLALEMAA